MKKIMTWLYFIKILAHLVLFTRIKGAGKLEVLVCPPSGQMRIAQNTKGALVKLTGESFRVTSTSSCSVKNEVGSIFEKEVPQCDND
jgi:hypothetical protein